MKEEFHKKLVDLAKLHNVRHDLIQGVDEFSRDTFEQFLRDVQVITKGKSKQELALNEYNLSKITRILTPCKSKNAIYSFRNIRALFSAIFNCHEPWMEIQDSFEFGTRTNSYNRKVWKYKMMIRKLNSEVPDALEQASKGEFDLLENLTRD